MLPRPKKRPSPASTDHRPARRPRVTVWRGLRNVLLATAVFVGAAGFVHTKLPFPDIEPARTKHEQVVRNPGLYDLIFFGSSHTLRGIVPGVFDRKVRKHGIATRSFNFGVLGSRWHETSWTLRTTLDALETRPRFVVVEVSGIGPKIQEDNYRKPREIAWHDLAVMPNLLHAELADPNTPRPVLAAEIAAHLMHFGMNQFSVGQGPRLLVPPGDPLAEPAARLRYVVRSDGYADIYKTKGKKSTQANRRNARYLDSLPQYEALIKKLVKVRQRPKPPPAWFVSAALAQARRIAAIGAQPVYYVPAMDHYVADLDFLEEAGIPVIRFDDPESYPDLYSSDHRFDSVHLNDAGARILSGHFAREFAARFAERRAASLDRPSSAIESATQPSASPAPAELR